MGNSLAVSLFSAAGLISAGMLSVTEEVGWGLCCYWCWCGAGGAGGAGGGGGGGRGWRWW